MEDKYPIKEIKVMEGVYIWKPEKAQDNNNSPSSSNNDKTNNKKMIYKKRIIPKIKN